jgi:hypothetical protein
LALPVISVHAAATMYTSGSNYVFCVDREKGVSCLSLYLAKGGYEVFLCVRCCYVVNLYHITQAIYFSYEIFREKIGRRICKKVNNVCAACLLHKCDWIVTQV